MLLGCSPRCRPYTANESIVLLLTNDGGTYGVGTGDVFNEVTLTGSTDGYNEPELTNANSGITFPFTFNQIKGQRKSGSIFGSGMAGIRVDGEILVDAVNDSQVWSNFTTGQNQNGIDNNLRLPATNAFDGNSSTVCRSDNTDDENFIVFNYSTGVTERYIVCF